MPKGPESQKAFNGSDHAPNTLGDQQRFSTKDITRFFARAKFDSSRKSSREMRSNAGGETSNSESSLYKRLFGGSERSDRAEESGSRKASERLAGAGRENTQGIRSRDTSEHRPEEELDAMGYGLKKLDPHISVSDSILARTTDLQPKIQKLNEPIEDHNAYTSQRAKYKAQRNDLTVRSQRLNEHTETLTELQDDFSRRQDKQRDLKQEFDQMVADGKFVGEDGRKSMYTDWLHETGDKLKTAAENLSALTDEAKKLATHLKRETKVLDKSERNFKIRETFKEVMDLSDLFAPKNPYFSSAERKSYAKKERDYPMIRSKLPDSCATSSIMMMLHAESPGQDVKAQGQSIVKDLTAVKNLHHQLDASVSSDSYVFKERGARSRDLPYVLQKNGSQKNWQFQAFNKDTTTFETMKEASRNGPMVVSIFKEHVGGHALVVDSIRGDTPETAQAAIRDPYDGSFYKVNYKDLQDRAIGYTYDAGKTE